MKIEIKQVSKARPVKYTGVYGLAPVYDETAGTIVWEVKQLKKNQFNIHFKTSKSIPHADIVYINVIEATGAGDWWEGIPANNDFLIIKNLRRDIDAINALYKGRDNVCTNI